MHKKRTIVKIILSIFVISILTINTYALEKQGWITENGKTYYYENGIVKQWWQKDENGIFYLQADGSVKQGLQTINGIIYYVENNYIYKGEKVIDNQIFAFNEKNGEMKYGSVRLSDGNLMYIEKDGTRYKDGWIESNGFKYYQKENYLVEGFQTINDKTYYFEPDTGKLKQWWQKDENGVFYLQKDGSIKQGLQIINGIIYYVENNYIYSGEKILDNQIYVFNDRNGEMKYGSVKLSDGNLMYIEKDGTRYKDGWIESNGFKYYQKENYLVEGFQTINNKTYYFEPNTGKLKQWWQQDENGVFYLQADGSVKQGLQTINGIIYYVENNYIYKGEKVIDNQIFSFNEKNGEMKYGSIRLPDGNLYYIEKNGTRYKDGWIKSNGNKYYQKDNYLVEGFQTINNKTYYFEPDTGKLKQWWQQDENGIFYLQADGSVKQGLQTINGIIYYVENNYIYKGEKVLDNEFYSFNKNGELITGIYRDSNNNIRYSTIDGKHPKGWINQSGYIYYIKDDGTACVGNENVENRDYFFGDDGVLWGFYWENNKLYYKNPDGSKAKGIEYIGGQYIQFNVETGEFEKYVRQVRVIDVSAHQGKIDWETVKASGLVDAVILRLGYASSFYDSYFLRNKSELERLGIPYSVYLFSYAETAQEALGESNFVINTIKQNNVHIASNIFSVYYDLEDWEIKSTGENSYGISKETYGDMITTFVDNVEKNLCVKARVYASKNYIETRFPTEVQKYATWVAQWNDTITYQGAYEGWQYSSTGSVPGISTKVDMNIFYY